MKHNPGFLALVTDARSRVRTSSVADVHARVKHGDDFHFVDVREDSEFAVDHVAGAQHIGRGILERDVETLIPDKQADIVLYCAGGFRSVLAADNLQKMGYTNVVSMDGGIREWRAAGYDIESGRG